MRDAASPKALPSSVCLLVGFALCALIAAVALAAGRLAPVIGGPIFAIAMGVILANTLPATWRLSTFRIGDVAKYCLKGGIVLLGATLDLGAVARVGEASLPTMAASVGAGLLCAWLLGARMRVHWRMRALIGVGTVICGGSAIAAVAPIVRARAEEIAYSISVIFFFNMVAVFLFPALGHALRLSDQGFGLWSGAAVNDTSAVVAAGFAYSRAAGSYAVIVKLTRTVLIIPVVLIGGLLMARAGSDAEPAKTSVLRRVLNAFPVFIIAFLLASASRTTGLIRADMDPVIQQAAQFVLLVALSAVGLQGHWRAFAGAGARPILLGLATWVVVAVSALVVQRWSGLG